MTKDEFIVRRLHNEATVYRITVPILIACVVAAVVMSIIGLATGRGVMSLGPALIMTSIALQIPSMIQKRKAYRAAEQEYAAYVANPAQGLSDGTRSLVNRLESSSTKDLRQLVVAYGLIGAMLLGMGIFLFSVMSGLGETNAFYVVVLPVGMGGGGLFLCLLAFKAWRDLKVARDIQSM